MQHNIYKVLIIKINESKNYATYLNNTGGKNIKMIQ